MILHLDLDCFFAAAHRINETKYNNIPIAVGGRSNLSIFDRKKEQRELSKIGGAFTSAILTSNKGKTFEQYYKDKDGRIRGILTTSSYEARAYGVKTAMSVTEALQLCPHLVVIPPNYSLYHELSHKLKLLLEKEIPSLEQYSIDEFFGDVSGWVEEEDVYDFAVKLKIKIKEELGLPISIGISKTKWIAKIATNDAKPFGVKYIKEKEVASFVKDMKIADFPGIGKGYEQRLLKYHIKTLGEVKNHKELFYSWGKSGIQLYNRICGTDNYGISIAQERKSIGLGRSFDPISDRNEIERRINVLCRHVSFLCLKGNYKPLTFSLQIRYQYGLKSYETINANRLFNERYLKLSMQELFYKIDMHKSHSIIQLNLTLGNFDKNKYTTFDLLNYDNDNKEHKLGQSMQKLRNKFGIDIIKSAGEM